MNKLKWFFPKATITEANSLPKKQADIFCQDLTWLQSKIYQFRHITLNTKITVWLNNNYIINNKPKMIKNNYKNSIMLDIKDLNSKNKLQIHIKIPYSIMKSIDKRIEAF